MVYNEGAQYGTLNSYRSALALILGDKISDNQYIKRFFKGVYRSRPLRPKYNETWDTSVVLNFLDKWYPNEGLNKSQISKKLITLFALVTAHRVQTFSKIKISNIVINQTEIKIKIPDQIKTSRPGSMQPLLTLPFFNERPQICPAKTLLAYIEMTRSYRENHDFLFISLNKPIRPVGTQTLSRWIKDILGLSGIDTSTFTAHSTRHAATSAAQRLGVNIEQIRKTAGWSSNSETFARFYNRPIIRSDDCIARSLLNNSIRN